MIITEWIASNTHIGLLIDPTDWAKVASSGLVIIPSNTIGIFPHYLNLEPMVAGQEIPQPRSPLLLLKVQPFSMSCFIPSLFTQDNVEVTLSLTVSLFIDSELTGLQKFCHTFVTLEKEIEVGSIFTALYPKMRQSLDGIIRGYPHHKLTAQAMQLKIQQKLMQEWPDFLNPIGLGMNQLLALKLTVSSSYPQLNFVPASEPVNLHLPPIQPIPPLVQPIPQPVQPIPQPVQHEMLCHTPPQGMPIPSPRSPSPMVEAHQPPHPIVPAKQSEQQPPLHTGSEAQKNNSVWLYWIAGAKIYRMLIVQNSQPLFFGQLQDYPEYHLYADLEKSSQLLKEPRAIRILHIGGTPTLAVGTGEGVILFESGYPRMLRYNPDPHNTKGYNAMVYFAPYLYATHSNYGLVRWDLRVQPSIGEPLILTQLQQEYHTQRCLELWENQIYFAIDQKIIACHLHPTEKTNVCIYEGSKSEITSLVVTQDEIYAGNANGQVLSWAKAQPASSPRCLLSLSHTIYMLRPIMGQEELELVLSCSGEKGIVRFSPNQKNPQYHTAPVEMNWVAACHQVIVGVGEHLHSLLVWNASNPSQTPCHITTTDTILDLIVTTHSLAPVTL